MTRKPLWLSAGLAIGLGGCAAALDPQAFTDTAPELRPELFFAGTTTSTGVLENRAGAPTRQFRVHGTGTPIGEGAIRLEQDVAFDKDAPQHRIWDLHRLDAHRYTGTLSDAVGTVQGETYGNLFHLAYAMKSPAGGHMEQWLYLQPDGHTVVNEATVTIAGFVAVHLSERITHAE